MIYPPLRPRRKPRAKRLPPPLAALLDRLPTAVAVQDRGGPDGTLRAPVAWCRLARARADDGRWELSWRIVRCPRCGAVDDRGHIHTVGAGRDPYDCLGPRAAHCGPLGAHLPLREYVLVPLPLEAQPAFARAYYDAHARADADAR